MPLQVGVRLGPYEILSALGAGGMGEVYRARDSRLERDVAIKVLPTTFTPGSRQLVRFEHEARLLASLHHPNICAIYDVGSERGVSFIVMELLQGETLGARINRGPISSHVALHYAIQIVDALRAAHSAGLVHRDVKPGNIMLTTTGVKLLDFGLAKRRSIAADERPPVDATAPTKSVDMTTQKEGVIGTLHYMAPEQLAGGDVDARIDIWAFGCVLYEMVTGRRAFTGKTLTDVIAAIVTEQPLVMTIERDVVPLALEHVVARCLARNPSERWQTAADLARELMSMLQHTSSGPQTAPGSSADAVPQPAQGGSANAIPQTVSQHEKGRRTVLTSPRIAIAAAALLLVAAGAWFMVGRGVVPPPVDSVAVLPFATASGTADVEYLSEGLAQGVIAELARIPRARVVAPSAIVHAKSSSDPRQTGRSLGVARVVSGRLLVRGGRLDVEPEIVDVATGSTLWSGHYSEPLASLLPLQRELIGGIVKALRLEANSKDLVLSTVPSGLNSEAYRLILRGRYALNHRSESSLRSAIGFFTEAAAKDSRAAAVYAGLADCYNALAQFTVVALRPSEAFPKSKKAAMRALELDQLLAEAHAALGFAKMSYDWDWRGAGVEYERAIELQPYDPSAHQLRADWLMDVGRSDEALAEARNATTFDPLSPSASLDLGWQLYLAHRYSDSIDQLKATIKLDPDSAAAHWALGAAYEKSGRLDEAIRELQTANTMSAGRPFYLAGLGYAYARAGRLVEARQVLDRLRASATREYVSPFDMALVAVGLDDRETAFKWLKEAVDDHATAVASLGVDPRFDGLRSDPRFKDLLKRIGL